MLRGVVKGVQCDPEYGEDSPLYRAMGFVTFSKRKSGLIRRPKAAPPTIEKPPSDSLLAE